MATKQSDAHEESPGRNEQQWSYPKDGVATSCRRGRLLLHLAVARLLRPSRWLLLSILVLVVR